VHTNSTLRVASSWSAACDGILAPSRIELVPEFGQSLVGLSSLTRGEQMTGCPRRNHSAVLKVLGDLARLEAASAKAGVTFERP